LVRAAASPSTARIISLTIAAAFTVETRAAAEGHQPLDRRRREREFIDQFRLLFLFSSLSDFIRKPHFLPVLSCVSSRASAALSIP
jgi:hypothetical protein